MLVQLNMKELAYLSELTSQNRLSVEILQALQLFEAVSAHEVLETGGSSGKLVFKVTLFFYPALMFKPARGPLQFLASLK